MNTCTIETGLLSKKPCGKASVAMCVTCDQHLCIDHAIAQLSEAGRRTGKFMCAECVAAAKDHAKSMAAVARSQEAKKLAALDKMARDSITAPAAPKKPVARPTQAPAQPPPAEQPKESGTLEFIPKDGKLGYTTKKDG